MARSLQDIQLQLKYLEQLIPLTTDTEKKEELKRKYKTLNEELKKEQARILSNKMAKSGTIKEKAKYYRSKEGLKETTYKSAKFSGKLAGKGITRGGKLIGKGILSGGKILGKALSSTAPKKQYTAEDVNGLNGLYFAVIVVHMIDWLIFKFAINPSTLISRTILYILLAVYGHFALKNEHWTESVAQFKWLIILPVLAFPLLGEFLTTTPYTSMYADKISAFILAVPIWWIYLNGRTRGIPRKNQGIFMKFSRGYFTLLFIFMIIQITVLTSMNISQISALQTTGMDPYISFNAFKEWLINTTNSLVDVIKGSVKEFNKKTLGLNYRGKVEKTAESTGFEISKFKPTQNKYINDKNNIVEALATIEVKQLKKESLVNLDCYMISTDHLNIEKVPGKIKIAGEIGNTLKFDKYYSKETVTCQIPLNTLNTEGKPIQGSRFQVVIEGNVDYEMTASLRYYFIYDYFADTLKEPISATLGIPSIPESISNEGPMTLKASSEIQTNPVIFHKNRPNKVKIAMQLAPSTTNTRTAYGKIDHVNYVDYYLPPEFSNVECIPTTKKEWKGKDENTGFNILRTYPTQKNTTNVEQICTAILNEEQTRSILPIDPAKPSLLDTTMLINTDYNYHFQRRSLPINLIKINTGALT